MKYKLQQTGDEVQEILNKPTATIAQVDAETQRAENAEAGLREDITEIENKIPSAASSSNQLADKEYVNSSVATATATFRGTYNLVTDLQLTTDATHAAIAAMLAQTITTADANDYCFVQVPVSDAQPTVIEVVARYKFGANGWEFEYDLNNSGFTADQWAAINSHITSGLVTKLDNLPDNAALTTLLNGKQDVISDLSAIREGAAAGATAYQKPVGGIPKTDLASGVQTSLDAADAAAPQSTTYTKTEVDGLVGDEETRAKAAEEANASDIDAIEGKIPVAASTSNQLADKDFVNSSVATATATFRGTYNLVTDLQLTTSATHAAIAAMLAQTIATADANDYCFVQVPVSDAQPTVIEVVARYKFGANGWEFEYDLNNSGFTADQWAAINSHITSGLVTKLDNLPDNAALTTLLNGKQDVISDLSAIREGAAAGATAYQKPVGGIPKTDLASGVQTSLDAADAAAPQSTTYTKTEVDGLVSDEETRAKAAEEANASDIDAIEGKIPVAATTENQLADKAFVNSSVATATATFRGTYNLVTDLQLTTSATHAAIAAMLAQTIATADANDYCFVQVPVSDAQPTVIEVVARYKFGANGWEFEYDLNNSGFTADQWSAINSHITSGLVTKLDNLPDNAALTTLLNGKQDVISDLSAIREGAAAGATAYQKPVGGIPKTDLASDVQTTLDAANAAAPQSTTYTKTEVDGLVSDEETRAKAAEEANTSDIDAIEGKIPVAATTENQLADKAFVNSSVATATATFRGTYNLVTDLQLTTSATHAAIAAMLAQTISTADANDYCFVQVPVSDAQPTVIEVVARYKFGANGWEFEYDLNNSGFTAAQWSAINSHITSGLVTKLDNLPDNAALTTLLNGKQDVISDLSTIRSGAAAGATAYQKPVGGIPKTDLASGVQTSLDAADAAAPQSTTYTKTEVDNLLSQKQNTLTFDDVPTENSNNPVKSGGIYAQIKAFQDIIADLEVIAEGYVRVSGSSSPALSYKSYKYHEQGGFGRESAFHIFYPCLVGTPLTGEGTEGHIRYVLKKFGAKTVNGVAKWEDLNGNLHNIDGTEGDVLICNVEKYHRIIGKHTINGTEYDVFLMSLMPFTWQGIDSEEVGKYGVSPDYCVSHTDSNNINRMHSVYNPEWNGSYTAPQGVTGKYLYSYDEITGDIVETYDVDSTLLGGAGGLHTTDLSLPAGEQRAMNNNPDTTKTIPWMNYTAAMAENLMVMLLAEGGTFDSHNANLMGSGFTSNDMATSDNDYAESATGAKNGLRVKDKNDIWKYYSLGSDVKFLTNSSSALYAANVINSWRNPWHIMEAQRAISFAIQNDVHELEWFVFEGNKYKWRSVNGFVSPAEGEMTCVVWKLLSTQAGSNAVDPTDGVTSIAGNRVEVLLSTAMIHGITTQVSPCWWTSGLVFAEDEEGTYKCYMERDQSQLMITPYGDKVVAEYWDFETKYKHIVDIAYSQGYARDYNNDAIMLPPTSAAATGGGLHTYVGRYNWFSGTKPTAGYKSVRGFLRGSNADSSILSPLTMNGNRTPSDTSSYIAFGTCCQIVN